MGLFGLFGKKPKSSAVNTTSAVVRLDRLTPEGKLPYGWYTHNRAFTERIEHEHHVFVEAYVEGKKKSPKEYYAALKSLTQHTADVRKLCASKDECFVYWSTALFGDQDYQAWLDELKYVEEHLDELSEKYEAEQHILKKLPSIIKKNPGILQTEVYKLFPSECKGIVSSSLYSMEKRKLIVREKSGRTYSLRMADK